MHQNRCSGIGLLVHTRKFCSCSFGRILLCDGRRVSYNAIDKKLNKANLPMKIKKLRSYYATEMRKAGLLSEQIDLIEGRIGTSIFLMHYFKENPKLLSEKILDLLPSLENNFDYLKIES
jgi:hypothetical protein